jgi:hypothetical protein
MFKKSEENGEVKENTGKLIMGLAVVCFLFFASYSVITHANAKKLGETVSIQKYNTLEKRMQYLYIENIVKNQIIYDLVVTKKLDSTFVFSVSQHIPLFVLNSKDKNALPDSLPDKTILAIRLNSACADWYESIPFMFMDAKHDSAWVLKSESYKTSIQMARDLRNIK